ncbi:hypothetical protein G7Y89_g10224 [Cudoniella acicularis]|uniref:Uncharacterized protein n=1 Tax=Cudoniella acicularis TaxID=354080 RepID=A0A8H4VZE8_9HELO|nr:hypothetical protein G7Y89_g10224 [Cudoniella acicularis]
MLLQKTGWRIKRFISHRRKPSLEETVEGQEECSTEEKLSTNTTRRLSWLSQSPYSESLRRTNSSATTKCRPLPPSNNTAYSSASSLCSCECQTNSATIECSLSKPAPSPDLFDILYLPLLPAAKTGDAKTWQLIFSEPVSRSSNSPTSKSGSKSSLEIDTRISTFDLLEALSMDPVDNDKTPTQSIKQVEDSEMDDLSADVDQLIRDTDEAFKAVGSALADAKAATQGWYDTPAISTIKRTPTIPRGVLKKNSRNNVPAVKSLLSRSVSVSKSNRKKSTKKRKTNILTRAMKSIPPPPANMPSRWTLTDMTTNMVDVFSGKLFRTEVDEMLTPGRMLQLKQELRIESEKRVSVESTRSEDTEGSTPTEPFHLEGLVGRLEMLRKKPPFPSPVLPPPATPKPRGRTIYAFLPRPNHRSQNNTEVARIPPFLYCQLFRKSLHSR